MPVLAVYEFKGHSGAAAYGVEVAAGGAKTAFTSKWDKVKFAAAFAAVYREAVIGITAVKHFMDIFKNGITDSDTAVGNGVEMVGKHLLDYCHI